MTHATLNAIFTLRCVTGYKHQLKSEDASAELESYVMSSELSCLKFEYKNEGDKNWKQGLMPQKEYTDSDHGGDEVSSRSPSGVEFGKM